jgi:hypothetical protein
MRLIVVWKIVQLSKTRSIAATRAKLFRAPRSRLHLVPVATSGELKMRKLLIFPLASLACITPALAQDVPQNPAAVPNGVENQETLNLGVRSIEGTIHSRLALAGFTDIEMVPTSFLVRAKDRSGKPVMMMLSPDAIAELKEVMNQDSGPTGQDSGPAGQDSGPAGQDSGPDGTSRGGIAQPRRALPGANGAE